MERVISNFGKVSREGWAKRRGAALGFVVGVGSEQASRKFAVKE